MKFGTLQNLRKESPPSELDSDEENFNFGDENNSDEDESDSEFQSDDLDLDDNDSDTVGDMGSSVIDKLLSLRDEIEEILSDMGYTDDGDSDFGDGGDSDFGDSEETFDDERTNDAEFNDFDASSDMADGDAQDPKAQSEFGDSNSEFGDEEGNEPQEEDPDFQGDIRTVKGGDLVYKRKQEDGNYEELWIYNVGSDIRKETQIRKAILAGTDVVPQQRESEDGSQHCDTYTVGNVQYLRIFGLPN